MRSAAINQEIKRVLTDVLLKVLISCVTFPFFLCILPLVFIVALLFRQVTDELFEEIATKVLNEDEPDGKLFVAFFDFDLLMFSLPSSQNTLEI